MAHVPPDPWHWSWYGSGTADTKSNRGRTYYKGVESYRNSDNMKRIYNVGDTVNMIGDEEQVWTAQIVNLFQVRSDDEDLRKILRFDSKAATGDKRYELMRCTLRWFYNPEDMNHETLRRSSVPRQIRNEIYYSDHVEITGFNSVTVIDGMAWCFSTKHERDLWLRQPGPRYKQGLDIIRIVRSFVNSGSTDLPVRQLDTGELEYHIKNPCPDKNLFDTGRQRMRGKFTAAGTIVRPSMKTLGNTTSKKRKRGQKQPINLIDDSDDDDYEDAVEKKDEPKLEDSIAKVESKRETRKEKRRKIIIEDDDEEPSAIDATASQHSSAAPVELEDKQRADLHAAQSEVLDMVNELNQIAVDFDPNDALKGPSASDDEDVITPVVKKIKTTAAPPSASNAVKISARQSGNAQSSGNLQRHPSSPAGVLQRKPSSSVALTKIASQVIVIDGEDQLDDEPPPHRMVPSITPRRGRFGEAANYSLKAGRKKGAPFMPTSREKNSEQIELKKSPKEQLGVGLSKSAQKPVLLDRRGESTSASTSERATQREIDFERRDEGTEKVLDVKKTSNSRDTKEKVKIANAGLKNAPLEDKTLQVTASDRLIEKRFVDEPYVEHEEEPASEIEMDWSKEISRVLQQLKTEFGRMSPNSQTLFRTHVDFVFDLAVKKVTAKGLYGQVDSNNKDLTAIVAEIREDLGKLVSG